MQIGQEVFVFVDFGSQLAVHNFGIGSFMAGFGPPGSMSPFLVANASNVVEHEGEQLRVGSRVQAPSRLDCLYVYDSLDECREVSVRHDWPFATVRRATIVLLLSAFRANMELITLLNGLGKNSHRKALWTEYWAGRPGTEAATAALAEAGLEYSLGDPIWEWLIQGRIDFDSAWIPPETTGEGQGQ